MSTELIPTTPGAPTVSTAQWQMMMEQAAILVESGLLPREVNTAAKAAAVMLKGWELRIPSMYALSNIAIINGKPVASAELMLALIYRDHGDDAVHFLDTSAARCLVAYKRRGWTAEDFFEFTLEDARRAGLLGNPAWQKYPQAMLRARAISAVARLAFPDSIGGMYTPEELNAPVIVDAETGEVRLRSAGGIDAGEEAGQIREIREPGPSAPGADPVTYLRALARSVGVDRRWLREHFGTTNADALTPAQVAEAIALLEQQRRPGAA